MRHMTILTVFTFLAACGGMSLDDRPTPDEPIVTSPGDDDDFTKGGVGASLRGT
jgi:hypothetical protein